MAIITDNGISIISDIRDVIFYINNDDLIETVDQVKDINRIFNDNLYRLSNKKYYIEKLEKINYKWYR